MTFGTLIRGGAGGLVVELRDIRAGLVLQPPCHYTRPDAAGSGGGGLFGHRDRHRIIRIVAHPPQRDPNGGWARAVELELTLVLHRGVDARRPGAGRGAVELEAEQATV